MMAGRRFALLVLAMLPAVALAQPIHTLDGRLLTPAAIDAAVARLMRDNGVTGLGLTLIQDGQIAYCQGYGFADVAAGRAMTANTVMHAASLTKAAFATMVMQLADEGRLDLDRPISAYLPKPLPDYPHYGDLAGDDRWRKLTFRILLDHSTGFANYRAFEDDGRLHLHWDPGTRFGYSGEGFNLAQFVLEQGMKLDVAQEMRQRIFDRFGMARTSMTWRPDLAADDARGYGADGSLVGAEHRVAVRAASSMETTLSDFSRFLAAVVRGEGLSAGAGTEMTRLQIGIDGVSEFPTLRAGTTAEYRPIDLGYGLGWGVFETPYGHAFFKEGHDDGVENYALCIQPRKTCLLLLSNSNRAVRLFKPIVELTLGNTHAPWAWEGYAQ